VPTENSLRNLQVTSAQRAENLRRANETRHRQMEANYARVAEQVKALGPGVTQLEAAKALGLSTHMVGRAVRWARLKENGSAK
jgi:hypothetical protein